MPPCPNCNLNEFVSKYEDFYCGNLLENKAHKAKVVYINSRRSEKYKERHFNTDCLKQEECKRTSECEHGSCSRCQSRTKEECRYRTGKSKCGLWNFVRLKARHCIC